MSQVRVIVFGIPKSRIPMKDCISKGRGCKAGMKAHIHKEDLVESHGKLFYALVHKDKRPEYEKILKNLLMKAWHEKQLEPYEEIAFHDGIDKFQALSVCIEKSRFRKILGLQKQLSQEQVHQLVQKTINDLDTWNLTPMAA